MKAKEREELLPDTRRSLHEMEATGGEPDVIARSKSGQYTFCDCSAESRVFAYHNGAQSYYAARGFRGSPRVSATVDR